MAATKAATELSTYVDLSQLFLLLKVSTISGDAVADETGQISQVENMKIELMAVFVTTVFFVLVNYFYICSHFKVQMSQKKLLQHLSDMLLIPQVVKVFT